MNKTKILKAAMIIAVLLIPIIYSFFYLKAFWDPYSHVNNLPVAIVNLDEGIEGENLGTDLVDNLVEKNALKLDILNETEANTSLVNENYYAVLTIPKDFTKTIKSAEQAERKVVTITYSPNQKSNYLASQIINKVVTGVETELTSQINKETVETLTSKLNSIPDELQDISDGAGDIQNGTQELSDGLQTLNDGTSKLQNNYNAFDAGVSNAYKGSANLKSGIAQLDSGLSELHNGVATLQEKASGLSDVTGAVEQMAAGADRVNSGVTQYVAGVNSLNENVETLLQAIIAYGVANPGALVDPYIQKIYLSAQAIQSSQAIEGLKASGKDLMSGTSTLNSGLQQFKLQTYNLGQLTAAVLQLEQGTEQLKQGAKRLQTGSDGLVSGMNKLNQSSKEIDSAISQISDGTQVAVDGNGRLAEGVSTFKTKIDNGLNTTKEELENLNGLSEYAADPVQIDEQDYAEVETYGQSFAPFFMSISLWIGAFIIYIVLYYDPEDRFKILGRNSEHRFIRVGLYVLLAIAQALVMGVLLKWSLGFNVTNIWLYYGSCVLVSMVFFSIMQFFIFNFKDVGKFIVLVLLILQLASSGATFPIETVPSFFQTLNNFMPMTYSIKLFREALISIDMPVLTQNLEILIGILVVFLVGTMAGDIFNGTKRKIIKYKENKKQF